MDEETVKPCGLFFCPLHDEWRFFTETTEQLMAHDVSPKDMNNLRGITIRVWCHGHPARGIEVDQSRCRDVHFELTQDYQGSSDDGTYASNLRKKLSEIEATPRDLDDFTDLAAF